jgi:hypothetical protein
MQYKAVQTHKSKTRNGQNKNRRTGRKQYTGNIWTKALNPENIGKLIENATD